MATAGTTYPVGNAKKALCLMAGATANNSAPSAAGDGYPMYPVLTTDGPQVDGHAYPGVAPKKSTLMIKGRVTAGQTLVGTFTLWGYLAAADAWFEIPVNGGTAITPVALAETGTDEINFQEKFDELGHYDRIALQLASIGGTGATFDAFLVCSRQGGQ